MKLFKGPFIGLKFLRSYTLETSDVWQRISQSKSRFNLCSESIEDKLLLHVEDNKQLYFWTLKYQVSL